MSAVIDLQWWISVIDIPAMSALFWMIWRVKAQSEKALQEMNTVLANRTMQLRDALNAHKLETAKSYARLTHVHTLEDRLTDHLLRIEAKLDRTALKTESLKGKNNI